MPAISGDSTGSSWRTGKPKVEGPKAVGLRPSFAGVGAFLRSAAPAGRSAGRATARLPIGSSAPRALSLPYYDLSRIDRLPKDGTWIVAYCACLHHLSGIVVEELRKRGYEHAAVLDEGILAWQRAGYPVYAASAHAPGGSQEARRPPVDE